MKHKTTKKPDDESITTKELLAAKKEAATGKLKTIGSLNDFNKLIDHVDND